MHWAWTWTKKFQDNSFNTSCNDCTTFLRQKINIQWLRFHVLTIKSRKLTSRGHFTWELAQIYSTDSEPARTQWSQKMAPYAIYLIAGKWMLKRGRHFWLIPFAYFPQNNVELAKSQAAFLREILSSGLCSSWITNVTSMHAYAIWSSKTHHVSESIFLFSWCNTPRIQIVVEYEGIAPFAKENIQGVVRHDSDVEKPASRIRNLVYPACSFCDHCSRWRGRYWFQSSSRYVPGMADNVKSVKSKYECRKTLASLTLASQRTKNFRPCIRLFQKSWRNLPDRKW